MCFEEIWGSRMSRAMLLLMEGDSIFSECVSLLFEFVDMKSLSLLIIETKINRYIQLTMRQN